MACITDDTEVWSPEPPPPLSAYLSNAIRSMLRSVKEKREAHESANSADRRGVGVALLHSDNVYKRPNDQISGTFLALVVLIRNKMENCKDPFLRPERRRRSKDIERDEPRNGFLRPCDAKLRTTCEILRNCS
jgi:hypothetical protein